VDVPETRYAKSADGVHIAYQVFGSGPPVVLIPPLVSNAELVWEQELFRRVFEYCADHVTIVQFDKRGIGASDRWEQEPTLESHERISAGIVERHRGRIVKSTGDGILATFDAPSSAVAAAAALRDELRGIGLPIRAGIHAGEIEVHASGDISGVAVNVAQRVEASAADGTVWVSSTVRDLLLGSQFAFEDRGERSLKGMDGAWRLYAVI